MYIRCGSLLELMQYLHNPWLFWELVHYQLMSACSLCCCLAFVDIVVSASVCVSALDLETFVFFNHA